MRYRSIVYGAAIAPWLLLSPTSANCGSGGHGALLGISADDVAVLSDWTVRRSGLKPADVRPSIAYRSPAELSALRQDTASVPNGNEVIALYDTRSRTLVLSNSWSGNIEAARSVIVHEIVHHLQRENGIHFACPAEQEDLAFAMQEAWLTEHGTSLEAEFGIDPLTRLALSLCLY